MNYQRIYDELICKYGTWEKPKDIYTERHRKIPGYLDGKYELGNAFYVPARVHYLCHVIWAKLTGHAKAWRAVCGMSERLGIRKSRMYEVARVNASLYQSEMVRGENNPMYGKTHDRTARDKMSNANLGRKASDETRKKLSECGRKRRHTDETKAKIGSGNKGKIISDEQKRALSESRIGKRLSLETRAKIGEGCVDAGKRTGAQRWKCDMCDMVTTPGALAWHHKSSGHAGKKRLK